MPTYAPGQMLFRLVMTMNLHSQICQNGFYFTNRGTVNTDSTPLSSHSNALIASFMLRIYDDIKLLTNNQLQFRAFHSAILLPEGGPISEEIILSGTGSQPDESLPSYCAAILSLRSGFGGKSYHGRLYFPGISENDTSDSKLDAVTYSQLSLIGDKLIANYGPTGSDSLFRYIIYSKKLGLDQDDRYTYLGIIPVVQCVARLELGTQRHRKIGVGT